MESFRLKLKVGAHEFEAEGDEETVKQQLAIWRELIGSPAAAPLAASPTPAGSGAPAPVVPAVDPLPAVVIEGRGAYDRLFSHRGRVVSLTVLPTGARREADAALLLLLGQKTYNGADAVTGAQLLEGLKLSGLPVVRVDRVWGAHADTNVIRFGAKRGVKYRLTHPGSSRAQTLAQELLSSLPA